MAKTKLASTEITEAIILEKVYLIRGVKVMLDKDVAEIYGTETFRLNEAVNRNIPRFPVDFMFQLAHEEFNSLESQNAISKNTGRGYPEMPNEFPEQGVAKAFIRLEFRNSYPGEYPDHQGIY